MTVLEAIDLIGDIEIKNDVWNEVRSAIDSGPHSPDFFSTDVSKASNDFTSRVAESANNYFSAVCIGFFFIWKGSILGEEYWDHLHTFLKFGVSLTPSSSATRPDIVWDHYPYSLPEKEEETSEIDPLFNPFRKRRRCIH